MRPFVPRFVAVDEFTGPGRAVEYSASYFAYPTAKVQDLVTLGDIAEEGLAKVKSPLLIVQSKADDWVAPEAPELIYQRVSTPPADKQVLWLERSGHLLTLDVERDPIHQAVKDFLAR